MKRPKATNTALPIVGVVPLDQFDWIIINSSGGKDSQTALRATVALADSQDYPRDRITVFHADLGRAEWKGVRELAEAQARAYSGLNFIVDSYRDRDGKHVDLLEYVRRRGRWPSPGQRYCTSEFKRSPGQRLVTAIHRRLGGRSRILQVFGFRAEESPARAAHKAFALDSRASTKPRKDGTRAREVYRWLPIHDWTEGEVWRDIAAAGVPHHEAYDLGMPRLSCCFCIFAPRAALIVAGRANPELLREYVQLESDIQHDFRQGLTLREVEDAIAAGETPGASSGAWNM